MAVDNILLPRVKVSAKMEGRREKNYLIEMYIFIDKP